MRLLTAQFHFIPFHFIHEIACALSGALSIRSATQKKTLLPATLFSSALADRLTTNAPTSIIFVRLFLPETALTKIMPVGNS